MKKWMFLFIICSLPLQADMVVLKKGEKTYRGKIEYRRNYLKIKTSRGTKTFKWKKIESILEFPLHDLHTKEEREKLEKRYALKLRFAGSRGAEEFYQLGLWCQKKGFLARAKKAWEAVIKLDPNHKWGRKKLGYLSENDQWKKASDIFAERLQKLKGKGDSEYYKLVKWCKKNKLYKEAEEAIRVPLRRNNYNRKAIGIFKKLVAKYRPKRSYIFPLKGRYKISVDRSRHHQLKCFALWAYDIVKLQSDGRYYTSPGRSNSDYYIWSEPIYAIGDGVVKYVADGFKDNKPGHIASFLKLNKILIDHGGGEYSFYGHIKKGSAVVKVGDKVKQGQMICRTGNSGASGMPHLHFTMMDKDYFSMPGWMGDFDIEIKGSTISIEKALLQEGWIVTSTFKQYFVKKKAEKKK